MGAINGWKIYEELCLHQSVKEEEEEETIKTEAEQTIKTETEQTKNKKRNLIITALYLYTYIILVGRAQVNLSFSIIFGNVVEKSTFIQGILCLYNLLLLRFECMFANLVKRGVLTLVGETDTAL